MKPITLFLTALVAGTVLAIGFAGSPRFEGYVGRSPVPGSRAAEHVTTAAQLGEFGRGLASLGAVLALGAAILKMRRFSDVARLQTPRGQRQLMLMTNAATIGLFVAQWLWIRNPTIWPEPTIWGPEALTLSPMFAAVLFISLLTITNLLAKAAVRHARLPVLLWMRPISVSSQYSTSLALSLLIPMIWVLEYSVRKGDILSVPFIVLAIYTIFCLRAAAASPIGDALTSVT